MKTERVITAIDSHTCGETTRFITAGLPEIPGDTMWEKTVYCQENLDHLRKTVALQPRGFENILGAILTEPCNPEADAGIILFHAGGFWEACGDSTFSSCKTLLELGKVEKEKPVTELKLDTAAGLLTLHADIDDDGQVGDIRYEAPPSYYQESTILEPEGVGEIHADIAYGGLSYAIVDPDEVGVTVSIENADELIDKGVSILRTANKEVDFQHPENPDLNKIQLMQYSAKPEKKEHDYKHVNIFGDGSLCISPAGTSISAKLAAWVAKGDMDIGDQIDVESPTNPDLVMKGKPVKKVKVGEYEGVIPELSTRSYIIGMGEWIIETDDPLAHGFKIGHQ